MTLCEQYSLALALVHMTCNTPTPGHPSTPDEAWHCLKHMFYATGDFIIHIRPVCEFIVWRCECTCTSILIDPVDEYVHSANFCQLQEKYM